MTVGIGVLPCRVGKLAGLDFEGPCGVLGHQGIVVRGDHRGDPDTIKVFEYRHNASRRIDIQTGGGFVGDQNGWAIDDGACDRQPLLFTAREFDWVGIFF